MNVLPVDVAAQVSPFGTAVSVGLVGADGDEVDPEEPFELSLDLSDVALDNAAGNLHERLRLTRFDDCQVFEPSAETVAEAAEFGLAAEDLPDEVICLSSEEVESEFDVESRTLTAVVDIAEIEEADVATEAALTEDGVPVADLDPTQGRDRSADPEDVGVLDASGNATARDLANPGVIEGQGRSSLVGAVFAQAGGGTSGSVYGVTSSASSSGGDFPQCRYRRCPTHRSVCSPGRLKPRTRSLFPRLLLVRNRRLRWCIRLRLSMA